MNGSELWSTASGALRAQFQGATWNLWLAGIRFEEQEANQLVLSAPSSLIRDRLLTRYKDVIEELLSEIAQEPMEIKIVEREPLAQSGLEEILPEVEEKITQPQRRPSGEENVNRRFVFDSFVIGPSNRFAHAAAMSVAESPAKSYNPLFIHGDAGLGKTHLLYAIGNYVNEHFPMMTVRYVSTETFMNEFVEAIRSSTPTAFKRRYRECDVLLVDDIQFLEKSDSLQEEFFHTFNSLYNASKQVVLTSDRPPRSLATVEDRLRSRFMSGLITDIQPPELETRIAILRSKAEKDGLVVPHDVQEFIATHVTNNIRELEGALIRVSAYASLNGLSVNLGLAETALADILASFTPRQITPSIIMIETADIFGFSIEDICGPSRRRPLVLARQIGMYLCRELTDYSYPAIAREFGNRDHTTVIHAVEKISSLMGERRAIYDQVTDLIRKIKQGNQ
ncbi:MAG: chromosomal replication initiator protein DnaA [Acidimicrobiales bacterium]|nr:chromosomal replication initiator protein DnaA [Acidimicrobiales bacterium]